MRQKPPTTPAIQNFAALNPATFVLAGPTHVCDGTCNHTGQNKKDVPSSYSSVNTATISLGPIQDHVHGPGCGCSDQPSAKQEVNQPQNFSVSVNPAAIMLPPGHVCDGTCDHSGQGKKDTVQPQTFALTINPANIMLPPGHVCDGTCDHSDKPKTENQIYSTINSAGIVLGPIEAHVHGPGCGCSDQSANKQDVPSPYSSVNAASLVLVQNPSNNARILDNQTDISTKDTASQGLTFLQQMNKMSSLQERNGRISQNTGFASGENYLFVLPSNQTDNTEPKLETGQQNVQLVQMEPPTAVANITTFYLPQSVSTLAKVLTSSVTESNITTSN